MNQNLPKKLALSLPKTSGTKSDPTKEQNFANRFISAQRSAFQGVVENLPASN
jgi:hypothetical protein